MTTSRIQTIGIALFITVLIATGTAVALPGNAPSNAGPPSELPDAVPGFVSDIHALIADFIQGTIDVLGPSIADTTPGDTGEQSSLNE